MFTGFTMAGLGMTKHHLQAEAPEWRRGVVVNAISAFLTALIVLIFATVKFNEGAWVVVIVGPIMYFGLIRLHRQYVVEDEQLEEGASRGCGGTRTQPSRGRRRSSTASTWPRHGRSSTPARCTPMCSVPSTSPSTRSPREQLEEEWRRLGLSDFPLDIQECEDRRLTRAALELAAETVADGKTELTILLPRRIFASGLAAGAPRQHRRAPSPPRSATWSTSTPPSSPTSWPAAGGRTGGEWRRKADGDGRRPSAQPARRRGPPTEAADREPCGQGAVAPARRSASGPAGTIPIGDAQWRQRVRVAGRVRSVRVQPRAGTSNLECLLADDSGMLLLVFQGRRRIPGIQPGARLVVEGMVGDWARRQAILNPDYELIAGPEAAQSSPSDGPVRVDDSCPWTPVVAMFSPIAGYSARPRRAPALGRSAVTSPEGDTGPSLAMRTFDTDTCAG